MIVLDKSDEILSLSADTQGAFKFKEMHKTDRLKSDLPYANDKIHIKMQLH